MTGARSSKILVALLLLASGAEFIVRGPIRLLRQGVTWNDFLSPYIQAKAWRQGLDPYSPQSLVALWPPGNDHPAWVDAAAATGLLEGSRGMPSPYPLPSLVIISPLTAVSWIPALVLWSALSTSAILLAVLALLSICGCSLGEIRSQLFVAAVLALAPLHTGLGTANPAILVASLMVLAHWATCRRRDWAAGVLLALAICLKPTVAGGLLLYYVIRRKWRVAAVTCTAAALITIFGASWLALTGVHWWSSYAGNTRKMFASGSIDDFSRSNQLRFDMINIQVLLGGFLNSAGMVSLISRAVGLALTVAWFWRCVQRQSRSGLIEISAVLVISLVAVYHRFYDAALLIWPLAWSILQVKKLWVAGLTMAVIAPFFVPGQTMLTGLTGSRKIATAVTNSWWWNEILLPHQVWTLILLAGLLLWFMGESGNEALPEEVKD